MPPVFTPGDFRCVDWSHELVAEFGFHPYAEVGARRWRERWLSARREEDAAWRCARLVTDLMLAAKDGDVAALRSHLLAGHDVSVTDYDGRTALHVAAAEGHQDAVNLLLERCGFLASVRD
ncbi:hypothetical protein FOCC_FOCC016971, partial [Frankliniella occidentalis]